MTGIFFTGQQIVEADAIISLRFLLWLTLLMDKTFCDCACMVPAALYKRSAKLVKFYLMFQRLTSVQKSDRFESQCRRVKVIGQMAPVPLSA